MSSRPEIKTALTQAQKSAARVAYILGHWLISGKVIKAQIQELQLEKKQLDHALTALLRALNK